MNSEFVITIERYSIVESNQAFTLGLVLVLVSVFGFGFGFTAVYDRLSSLIGKLLVWFWFDDTILKTALSNTLLKTFGRREYRKSSVVLMHHKILRTDI